MRGLISKQSRKRSNNRVLEGREIEENKIEIALQTMQTSTADPPLQTTCRTQELE